MTTRTLTVLFTDLVDSTGLIDRLGAEQADAVLARHYAGLRSALAVHRGREVKALGDGLMGVFESVGDGLACAVTMQRSVLRHNGTSGRSPLAMRVGISTGELGEDDAGDLHGTPVVEASRLCDIAGPGNILTSDLARRLVGSASVHRLAPKGPMSLKGLADPVEVCELEWDPEGQSALRVALADDSALLRQGIAQVLESEGMEVVLQADDAEALMEKLPATRPNVVLIDVRMPPTHTTEGLVAAQQIRAEFPEIAVLVLSAIVHSSAAERLLERGTEGVGYLLKERVTDIAELAAAVRTVARGGSAIDPEVVGKLTLVA